MVIIFNHIQSHGEDLFFTIYKHPSPPPSVIAYDTDRKHTVTLCNPSPSKTVPISNSIRYTILTSRSVRFPDGERRRIVPSDARTIAWPIWPGMTSRSIISLAGDDGCGTVAKVASLVIVALGCDNTDADMAMSGG